ncbi:MAG: cob(I)yrinic acid a,c-diamide adenosyltransferase [Clostridiales bacterium]|nr:cob(I)yrinic acid a,c-diamide adenosyltransferase [Clostridiales bacterium]
MRGLIHIYCGDGKGKTTAAVGLAIRCAGGGGRVLYASFLKDNKSGERAVLEQNENILLLENPDSVKFYKFMTDEEKESYRNFCKDTLSNIQQEISKNKYDLLILDEIIPTINNKILPEETVLRLLDSRPYLLEAVLTGRNPSEALISRADYITEMKKIKHPYDKGIQARKYIEM